MAKKPDIEKLITAIVVLNILEIGVIAAMVVFFAVTGTPHELVSNPVILIVVLSALAALILNTLAAISNRIRIHRADSEYHLVTDTLTKLENLNMTLRSQRHDFMNNLQVVYSLIEMDEYADAREYIEKVYNDIQKVSRVMKTSNPAVNALLQVKMLNCEKKGVTVTLEVTTQLKELPMPSWEFCRVLGNLIDNAVYALEEKKSDMQLGIQLFEDLRSFGFKICDNGPAIPEEIRDRIFDPGFTTKGGKGEGMGLAISKSLMEEHGGWLKVRSGEGQTVFEGSLPRDKAG